MSVHDSPAVFLPIDRRHALAAGAVDLPDRAEGTAVFADLSGFTALTEALVAELGPRRGVEELSTHIGRIYEALVAPVHAHHGCVITYIGDALLCWFEGDPDDSAARALAAAHRMQAAMAGFGSVETPGGTPVSFAIKVGAAGGGARRFLVGDSDRGLLDVLAGSPVDRAVVAESVAAAGEILAGSELVGVGAGADVEWRDVEGGRFAVSRVAPRTTADPWPESPPGALAAETVGRWLPQVVYQRLRAGATFVSELRQAVPLFVRFEGLDFDRDDAGARLDEYVDRVLEILEPLEGTLLQVIAGDKGSHLYITFGAPLAHEDDPDRAVEAALRLRAMADRLPFLSSTHTGISRGRVFAGSYGAPSRLSYAVIGDPVNLAARLMSRAGPGEILASRGVAESVGAGTRIANAGSVALKGKRERVDTFSVHGRDSARGADPEHRTDVIGRASELEALSEGLDVVRSGGFRLVVLEGEAGIGKSHLLAEVARRAADAGVAVATGWADAIESRRAYHAWRAVFPVWLGTRAEDDPESRRAKVLSRLSEIDPELVARAPLLEPVVDAGFDDTDLTRQMSGEVRASNTVALLTRIAVRAARDEPLALFLEDAHWFDSSSWALLQSLRRTIPSALVVVTTRPLEGEAASGAAAELRSVLADSRSVRIGLGALQPWEASELAARRLGVRELPPAVTDLIETRAEGHPLFAREIVLALRDAGDLVVDGEEAALAANLADEGFRLPDTIEGVVTSRVDRLSPEQQLVAKVASVIGRTFALDTLHGVFPQAIEREKLAGQLDAIASRGLASVERPGEDPTYVFSHAIIHEVVYAGLLFSQRRVLHRSVAERIERLHAEALAPHHPLLAHHWENAGDVARALRHLEGAGQEAVASFANAEAIAFLSRADRLLDGTPDALAADAREPELVRARWRRLQAEARNGIGEFDRSHEDLRVALSLLGTPEPRPVEMFLRFLAQLARQEWHRRIGVPRSSPDDAPAAMERARIYRDLVYPYYVSGNALGGLYANVYMLNLVERYGTYDPEPGLLPHAMTNLAGAWLNILHNRAVGDRYLERAREHARREDDLPSLGWTYLLEGIVRMLNGDLAEAHPALDEAGRIYGEIGDPRKIDDRAYHFSCLRLLEGDLEGSRAAAEEQLRGARTRDDVEHQMLGLAQLGLCDVHAGRYDEAVERADEALTLAGERESAGERVFALGVRALASVRAGRDREARATFESAGPLLEAVSMSNVAIEGFCCLLDAVIEREASSPGADPGQLELGRRVSRVLTKNANRMSRIHAPRARIYRGLLDSLGGRAARAARHLRSAAAAARAAGLPYEVARASLERARHLPPGDPERDALLADAESVFDRLGFPWELARVRDTHRSGAAS